MLPAMDGRSLTLILLLALVPPLGQEIPCVHRAEHTFLAHCVKVATQDIGVCLVLLVLRATLRTVPAMEAGRREAQANVSVRRGLRALLVTPVTTGSGEHLVLLVLRATLRTVPAMEAGRREARVNVSAPMDIQEMTAPPLPVTPMPRVPLKSCPPGQPLASPCW